VKFSCLSDGVLRNWENEPKNSVFAENLQNRPFNNRHFVAQGAVNTQNPRDFLICDAFGCYPSHIQIQPKKSGQTYIAGPNNGKIWHIFTFYSHRNCSLLKTLAILTFLDVFGCHPLHIEESARKKWANVHRETKNMQYMAFFYYFCIYWPRSANCMHLLTKQSKQMLFAIKFPTF
jgi:hypothetical protein